MTHIRLILLGAWVTAVSGCVGPSNNKADGTELCDGKDLKGQTCVKVGFPKGGTLACNKGCRFDFTGCSGQPSVPAPPTAPPTIPTPPTSPSIPTAPSVTLTTSEDDNLPLILGITGGVGVLCSLLICCAGALGLLYAIRLTKKEERRFGRSGRGRRGNQGGFRGVVMSDSVLESGSPSSPCDALPLAGMGTPPPPGLHEYSRGACCGPLDEGDDISALPLPLDLE